MREFPDRRERPLLGYTYNTIRAYCADLRTGSGGSSNEASRCLLSWSKTSSRTLFCSDAGTTVSTQSVGVLLG